MQYDWENRLTLVASGGVTTTYVYDGDGQRASKTVTANGTFTTTYYVGNWLEVTGSTATTYYYLGSQRVAMKQGGTTTYLFGDHLGSTSATTNASGGDIKRQLYYPFGMMRASDGLATDFSFTGQRRDDSTATALGTDGLLFYNARYYDPQLGRFTQPDSIIPDWYNPQSLNRYSYVLNNPVKYTDPTGNRECGGVWQEACGSAEQVEQTVEDIFMNPARGQEDLEFTLIGYYGTHPDYKPWNDSSLANDQQAYATHVYATWNLDRLVRARQSGQEVDIRAAQDFYTGSGISLAFVIAATATGGNNPYGMNGNPAHQAAVSDLAAMANEEFAGRRVNIEGNRSIERWLGIDRRPDVVVTDKDTGQLLKVYEGARTDRLGNFVPREQQKMAEYWEAGIRYFFGKVK